MAARITETEFLKRAEQRFGDQFDYSEMRWRSFKSPLKIRCCLLYTSPSPRD